MDLFYSRVSTADQNVARQLEEADKGSFDKTYIDKLSGKDMNRPQLLQMLDNVREGDSVTVMSIDRLGRNSRDILNIVGQIKDKGGMFKCLSPQFDTTTPYGDFFLGILATIADLERKQILERQKQGIEIAKRNGKYKGRKPKELKDFEAIYTQWCEGKITLEQAGKLLGVSRATFYRRVKAYEGSLTVDF